MTTLRDIFQKFGCDKAGHCYHAFYETLPPPRFMLEVGFLRAASAKSWLEWFPVIRGKLIYIDTMDRFARASELLTHIESWSDRGVSLRLGDSRTIATADIPPLDLLIDDGSHKPRDQAATFRNLWPLLAPGGTYVIEDVVLYDRPLPKWFQDRAEHFNPEAFAELWDAVSDVDAPETIHDFRAQSGKPDSVLLVIRKP